MWNINISIYLNIRAAYLDIWIYELEKKMVVLEVRTLHSIKDIKLYIKILNSNGIAGMHIINIDIFKCFIVLPPIKLKMFWSS